MLGCICMLWGNCAYVSSVDSGWQWVPGQSREGPHRQHGGGRWERERERGREHPGAFHGAGQDVKVMSLSIRSAGPLAWVGYICVSLKEQYHEILSRHLSVSLFIQFSSGCWILLSNYQETVCRGCRSYIWTFTDVCFDVTTTLCRN